MPISYIFLGEIMDRIQNILLNILKDEKLNDYKGIGKEELTYTYKMQLFIISCKSLQYKKKGIGINYTRFDEEMNLLKYYINGTNESLEMAFKDKKSIKEDDSIVYRILPIALVNHDIKIIEEEVIKNATKTTRNQKSIIFGLITAFAIAEYIKNGSIDKGLVKEYVIRFSIKNYSDKYDFMDKAYILNFEKERIKFLGEIDNISDKKIEILDINDNIENTIKKDKYFKLIDNFSQFLTSVKRGSINLEKINIKKANKKFKIYQGNTFEHYLLGKSLIVKNDKLHFYIKTKYGFFKFRKQ